MADAFRLGAACSGQILSLEKIQGQLRDRGNIATPNDNEVDFVMTRGPRIVAVEVKSGAKTRPTRGMRVFENRFQPHRSLLVTGAEGGPDSVPLAEFLSRPASDWFEEVE